MSKFQASDKLAVKINALSYAERTAPTEPGGPDKLTADELIAAAKKIEAYLMEAETGEKE